MNETTPDLVASMKRAANYIGVEVYDIKWLIDAPEYNYMGGHDEQTKFAAGLALLGGMKASEAASICRTHSIDVSDDEVHTAMSNFENKIDWWMRPVDTQHSESTRNLLKKMSPLFNEGYDVRMIVAEAVVESQWHRFLSYSRQDEILDEVFDTTIEEVEEFKESHPNYV